MAVRKINESTLTDIADAIRSKTGGSALINPEDMADEIESISTGGGGGSLPSIISKIDGGSFTPSSDTQASSYSISHSLGVTPKGFVIWTEDDLSGNVATRYMANSFLTLTDVTRSNDTHYDAMGVTSLLYNGNTSTVNATVASANVDDFMNSSSIKWNNNLIYFKSGLSYKWLAWA